MWPKCFWAVEDIPNYRLQGGVSSFASLSYWVGQGFYKIGSWICNDKSRWIQPHLGHAIKGCIFIIEGILPVFGKELGSIHNSILQLQFFGIGFWNAPIPTPVVELGLQLQFRLNGMGGIPLGFRFQIFPLFAALWKGEKVEKMVGARCHQLSFSAKRGREIGNWNPSHSEPSL